MSNDVGKRQHGSSEKRWREILKLEKRRRGISEDRLLIVGVADLANFWWCAQQSLFWARDSELRVFANYVFHGFRLVTPGLYEEPALMMVEMLLKERDERERLRLLKLVDDNYKGLDLDRILREVAKKAEKDAEVEIDGRILRLVREGDKLVILEEGVECDLTKGEHDDVCRKVLRALCARSPEHASRESELGSRFKRGDLLHEKLAERHPSIFYAKEWDRYVIAGVPDGIGEDFVYEFKSTVFSNSAKYKWRVDNSILPVTRTQANIYAWIFNKRRWVVEIFSCADLRLYKWEGEVDYGDVERTLKGFKAAEEGGEILPPVCWKCESCKYRDHCKVKDRCRPSRRQGI